MPIFRYVCPACDAELKKFLTRENLDAFQPKCAACDKAMTRCFGLPESLAKETKDDYRNKSVIADLNEKLDNRADDHFKKHRLPRMIQEQGRDFCERRGWIDKNGNIL